MRPVYIIRTIVAAMLFAMLAWMLQGCKVQNCIPETIVRDSIVTEYKLDSIYLYEKDSIFIHEKADTVFINRFVTRYKDVMKIEHDTVYQDNKIVEVKEVLVEKPIAGVVKWFAWIGLAAVLIVVIKIGLKVYRKFVLHI